MIVCTGQEMDTIASVVVLGMFDGVHVGHQILLQKARVLARRKGIPLVVDTFQNHPLCLLQPDKCPPLLTTPAERECWMEEHGVDILCSRAFTEQTRNMPPEDFVGYLVRQWHPKAVVVGYNYTFGSHGAGTPALLTALGNALGFTTHVVPAIRVGGEPVSATRIRALLEAGEVTQARLLLGRPYERGLRLISRERACCRYQADANGKLDLPDGRYRAQLITQGHRYPVAARTSGQGIWAVFLPENVLAGEQATLRLIAESPWDEPVRT